MPDDPSNAVLAERIAELKEDVREINVFLRSNFTRIDTALASSVQKHAELDVKAQQNHDAVVSLKTIVEYEQAAHAKVHSDDTSRTRFALTIMCAAIGAVAALGLVGLALH